MSENTWRDYAHHIDEIHEWAGPPPRVVIRCCCGWETAKPTCEEAGREYDAHARPRS